MNSRFSQRQILLTGLLLVGVGLIANQWLLTALFSSDGQLSSRSVMIIWLFDATLVVIGLILVISRSVLTVFNFLVGIALTVLLLTGLEKIVFYHLNRPAPQPAGSGAVAPAPVRFEGSYTDNFFWDDPLLGYKPRPNSQVEAIKKQGDDIIYSVSYTIDEHSRRVTPQQDASSRDKFLLLFGDSFTFGEGVENNQTLPFYLSQLAPDYRTYNYGFSGYGPQQMLAWLQSEVHTREVPEKNGIGIYVFIDAHVERAVGSMYVYNAWGADMPYYDVDWSGGQLRKLGSFRTGRPLLSSLYEWLEQTEFARYYNLNIPGTLRPGHYWLTARIIAEARDTFMQKFPDSQFYIMVYPDEGDYFEDIAPFFEEFGLVVLNYDEWLKLDAASGTAIANDGHPTGKANEQVARWIVQDLGIERPTREAE